MPDKTSETPLSDAHARHLLSSCSDGEFVETLRGVLIRRRRSGWLTIDQAAALAGMSLRSFQRRLKDQGETFTELLDAARADVAKQLLQCTDRSLGQIAAELGYSKATNFARAFKRWTGKTPDQFRRDTSRANEGLA